MASRALATTQRVAVVTGSNKGIGYCIAEQLLDSKQFARVIVACRNKELGMEAAAKLGGEFASLDLADSASIDNFASFIESPRVGRLDCLVNNGAIAFKDADPTPFAEQTAPTLRVNYFGTARLTDRLLPLLCATGENPQVVNVASMAGRLGQIQDPVLRAEFADPSLTRSRLNDLVHKFENDVAEGAHQERGWGRSNYGFSKLAVIAYTKMRAREEMSVGSPVKVNCCCPGYCDTDMTSHRGPRSPAEGARNAVLLALQPPDGALNGEFIRDFNCAVW